MKKLFYILRKMILSAFFLYGYNIIAINFNLVIPINFYTLFIVSIMGVPGLFGLILFNVLF